MLSQYFPFVRRKRHLRAVNELNSRLRAAELRIESEKQELCRILLTAPDALARKTPIAQLIPIPRSTVDELCLFVTYAPDARLKQHVVEHVQALSGANIAVVLIINTGHNANLFEFPPGLLSKLHGLLVRENAGFDFAAWSHAYCLLPDEAVSRRLYLVNDSIVGPLDDIAYSALLGRIRNSPADVVGLTQNPLPSPHLQSFYLAFSQPLLRTEQFKKLMANVLNLPTKEAVIDVYEIQLSAYLQEQGFRCDVLFPNMARGSHLSDDTLFRWAKLIECGFPFIKASVLMQLDESDDAIRLVPQQYRRAWIVPPHPGNKQSRLDSGIITTSGNIP